MPKEDIPVDPPPLIQEPEPNLKTITIPTPKKVTVKFDVTKVLAAVGLILTVTLVLVAGLWIWIQTLEKRIETLEGETVSIKTIPKVATESAQNTATKSATASAE